MTVLSGVQPHQDRRMLAFLADLRHESVESRIRRVGHPVGDRGGQAQVGIEFDHRTSVSAGPGRDAAHIAAIERAAVGRFSAAGSGGVAPATGV